MIAYPNVKLNVGLRVLRRRPDGYHDLDTLFIPCNSFHDTLEIITGDDYSRTSAHLQETYAGAQLAQGITPDGKLMISLARKEGVDWDPLKDLTARAYALLAADFKLPPMKIFLEKTAPVGAGLGGGSSDAAFALRMISELAGLGLSDAQLSVYAARLGSDCAFFVYDRPMLGEGRGEVLTPFDLNLSGYDLQVIVPEGISVSTADAYKGIVPREAIPGVSGPGGCSLREAFPGRVLSCFPQGAAPWPPIPLREALSRPVSQWRECLVNDFEATVFAAHPELAAIKQRLYDQGAVYAAMSGSGSALFGLWPTAKK